MRFRIALATALAVAVIPAFILTMFTNTSTASAASPGSGPWAQSAAIAQLRTTNQPLDPKLNLMSWAQAEKVSRLATDAQAVELQKEESYLRYVAFMNYLEEVAYLKAVAASSQNVIPAAWQATAMCEEGGRNDPVAGYFGILAWNGFDGYPTAGSAPLSVQLAWEATYIGAPPDTPGHCHSY